MQVIEENRPQSLADGQSFIAAQHLTAGGWFWDSWNEV